MRYSSIRVVPLALALACTAASALHAQSRSDAAARRTIGDVNARFVSAYNAGDAAGAAKVYAPDAAVLPPNGPRIDGQPAIAEWWLGGWRMGIRNLKLTSTEVDVRGNSASEVGRYEFEVQPGSAAAGHDRGKYIVLWKRNAKGEWQWHRDIFNSDVPLPAAPAPATTSPPA